MAAVRDPGLIQNELRSASFEVAHFVIAIDQRRKNTVNHHNPRGQRGILATTTESQNLNPR